MSEVAIVAAVTGGTSVLTSAISALVTWKVSQNSSSVELAKVGAENERLQRSNREEERRNRQATYHQFLDTCTLLYQLLGVRVGVERREEVCNPYNHLLTGVTLFGPPSVRKGAHAVNGVYSRIWVCLEKEKAEHPDKPYVEQWRDATADLSEEFRKKVAELTNLMHADVTRGIASDPT